MTGNLFCFGLGYTAGVLAERLGRRGWIISGTTTSLQGAESLAAMGWHPFVYDGVKADPQIGRGLQDATHILLSIPPCETGDPAFETFSQTIATSPHLSWIGYLSTVGVYGDAGGGWVDEDTPTNPASERGRRRLNAEMQWLSLGENSGKCVMIFRLPGIYGPGRNALEDLTDGVARRIIKAGQIFNRIHVEDIATSLEAAIAKPHPGRIYNVTDDEPAPPQDVVSYAATLSGVLPPPEINFATAELSAMTRSFYAESKRVKNLRLKNELGVSLQFPTYREGLQAIYRQRR